MFSFSKMGIVFGLRFYWNIFYMIVKKFLTLNLTFPVLLFLKCQKHKDSKLLNKLIVKNQIDIKYLYFPSYKINIKV